MVPSSSREGPSSSGPDCEDWDRDGYGTNCPRGGDCNDQDGNIWQLTSAYPDSDGDMFYSNVPVNVCIGQGLPFGYTPAYPPWPDCDDSDNTVFQLAWVYPDLDGDGAGDTGGVAQVCTGYSPPAGAVWYGGDCDDGDFNTKPYQADFFPGMRSNGTWDYDCDGNDEQQYPQACQQGSTSAGWVGLVPSCGATGVFCTACAVNGGSGANCTAGIPQPCQ